MSYDWGTFGWGLLIAAVAVLAQMVTFFVVGKRRGRFNVVDIAWGLGFCTVAVVTFFTSAGAGSTPRRLVLLACVLVWGLRLAVHIGRRSAGKGEDPRYDELLDRHRGNRDLYAFVVVFLAQGLLVLFISLPVSVGMVAAGSIGVLGWLGVLVWAVGLAFESIGDRQMANFKEDPANKGKLIDIGLWRWTRHPNYFGDACVWTGLFLISAQRWPGVLTLPSLAVMVYLLAFGSGKRVLERSMIKRPGYREYMQRTSGFFPRPPRKSPQPSDPTH